MSNKYIIIFIIALAAISTGAFYGGTVYEKNKLSLQGMLRGGNNNFGNRAGQGGQGRPGGMGFNRGAGDGNFTTGEIISKDDKSITVKTPDGGSKIIFFSDSTTIGKSAQGTTADLNNGEQVMVNGKSNSDGTLTAQNIQIRSAEGN